MTSTSSATPATTSAAVTTGASSAKALFSKAATSSTAPSTPAVSKLAPSNTSTEDTPSSTRSYHGTGQCNDSPGVTFSGENPVPTLVVVSAAGTWLCCVPCYWLRNNSSVHKASLTVVTLLVTSLLVASPVLFLISAVPGSETNKDDCFLQIDEDCPQDVSTSSSVAESVNIGRGRPSMSRCESGTCRTIASKVLTSLDQSVPPCRDFYGFVCGGLVKRQAARKNTNGTEYHKVIFDSTQRKMYEDIQKLLIHNCSEVPFKKLGLFYSSCLRARSHQVDFSSMYSFLNDLGGYLPPGSLGPSDLTPLIISLLRVNGAILFDIRVDRDVSDTNSKSIITIEVPSQRNSFFTLDFFNIWKGNAEEKRMERLIEGFLPSSMSTQQKTKEIQTLLLFYKTLKKLQLTAQELITSMRVSYNVYNMTSLHNEFQFINWETLIGEFTIINETEAQFYVTSPMYLHSLEELLNKFHKRIIHNAFIVTYARDMLVDLVNSTQKREEWADKCTLFTTAAFSKEVASLYVFQFPQSYLQYLTKKMTIIFNEMKKTLNERIHNSPWLDAQSKNIALEKLSALRGHFFTWPTFYNLSHMHYSLKDVEIHLDDFFENVITRYRTIGTNRFTKIALYEESLLLPFILNAYYDSIRNYLVIPLALLTHPYFQDDVPSYVTYATIGNLLMHELLHIFDFNIPSRPNASEWFTSPQSRLGFEARVNCVVRQYAKTFKRQVKVKGLMTDVKYDWNITRNGLMIDIGGLQGAYQTWRNDPSTISVQSNRYLPGVLFKLQKLFFIIAGQMYCAQVPPEMYIKTVETDIQAHLPERLNGIIMNSPIFSEVFNCPLGSLMNPEKKCASW